MVSCWEYQVPWLLHLEKSLNLSGPRNLSQVKELRIEKTDDFSMDSFLATAMAELDEYNDKSSELPPISKDVYSKSSGSLPREIKREVDQMEDEGNEDEGNEDEGNEGEGEYLELSHGESLIARRMVPIVSLDAAKNYLQCLFQNEFGPDILPVYRVKKSPEGGDFLASVDLSRLTNGVRITGLGKSSKKKDAEKLAALDAIFILQQTFKTQETKSEDRNSRSYFNELYQGLWGSAPPVFEYGKNDKGGCTAKITLVNTPIVGQGPTKAKAANNAAEKAISFIEARYPSD